MELRPYQRECLETLLLRYRQKKRRMLVCLPTGTGKTVVFANFPRFFKMKKRLLILAHREELLEQAAEKFRSVDPSLSVGIEQAQRSAGDAQIVVASVPTLRGKRVEKLAPDDFYLIVVDEAHHAVAPSYRKILDHFGVLEENTPRMLVGFTATPNRGDKQSLGEVFEEIAYSKGLEEMIAAGYLAPVAGWRIKSSVDLDGVRVRAGDFVESELADAVNVQERNDLLFRAYRKLADGKRCVVFCVDVEHAKTVAEVFRKGGVPAEAVWGAMGRSERKAALERFHSGKTRVITNCNVLTEGFDEPAVECVLMARPTRSLLLYAQMVGRGTRLHPGKKELIVLDVADNSSEHELAGLPRLFDLPEEFDARGKSVLPMVEKLRQLGKKLPWIDLTKVKTPDDLEVAAERIEFFRFDPPAEIAEATDFAWLPLPGGGFRLGLPEEDLEIRPTLLGTWEVHGKSRIHVAKTPVAAVRFADRWVLQHHADSEILLSRTARWRDKEPSDKQRELLRARKIPIPPGLTRGQASWMLGLSFRS